VYHLRNGDRISGRTVSRTTRSFGVQTPFGRLNIPRARVEKIVRPDGTEESFEAPGAPAAGAAASAAPATAPSPAPASPKNTARLLLAVTGKTFWQAWNPKDGHDPTLRLEVRLDEEPVVVYSDAQLDPEEIKGAAVNAFSFAGDVTAAPAPHVRVHPPEVRPGRIVLRLDVRATAPSSRRLRLAYQMNAGTPEEPAWKDLVSASTDVALGPDQSAVVEVQQDRGRMEFSGFPRRRMKNVETFQMVLTGPAAAGGAP
jgi:hypothetical protein